MLVMVSMLSSGSMRPAVAADVSDADIQMLAGRTIFFGHQSVGWNILEGLEKVVGEHRVANWRVQRLGSSVFEGPAFFHAEIGQNTDPISKLEAFFRLMHGGVGDRVDTAFLKLCYVDFDKTSNEAALFDRYVTVFDELTKTYPNVRFLHFTAPLVAPERGFKVLVKQALGRQQTVNAKRHAFNELIRRKYGSSGVFDLAAVEATRPDGTRCVETSLDRTVPCLAPEYTDDGGHLNAIGREIVATRLVQFLSGSK